MKKKIVWEKWKDPMLSNYDETEWPGYDLDEDGNKIPVHTVERQPVMHTPFGMLSVMDHAMAHKQFDFWVMHTNFGLTDELAAIIEQVPGVETLEVYTRYRARVGFPRSGLFKPRDVMGEIQQVVSDVDHATQNQLLTGLEMTVAQSVIQTRDEVEKKYDHWAILVLPNGNVEVLGSDKVDESYREKLGLLQQAQAAVGGRLLTSESESEDA
jgi:hypothetical protein